MNRKRVEFSAEWEKMICEILYCAERKNNLCKPLECGNAAFKEFIEFAKTCVLRFIDGVPPYRPPATAPTSNWVRGGRAYSFPQTRTGKKVARDLEKALLKAEQHLKELTDHNENDPSFFLNALSRIHHKGQSPEAIRQIVGGAPFTGRPTEAITQFSALSSLLRAAASDMVDKWPSLPGGAPQGTPADALALEIALAYWRILGERPKAYEHGKFGQIVAHLIRKCNQESNSVNDMYLGEGFEKKTLVDAVKAAHEYFEPSNREIAP